MQVALDLLALLLFGNWLALLVQIEGLLNGLVLVKLEVYNIIILVLLRGVRLLLPSASIFLCVFVILSHLLGLFGWLVLGAVHVPGEPLTAILRSLLDGSAILLGNTLLDFFIHDFGLRLQLLLILGPLDQGIEVRHAREFRALRDDADLAGGFLASLVQLAWHSPVVIHLALLLGSSLHEQRHILLEAIGSRCDRRNLRIVARHILLRVVCRLN